MMILCINTLIKVMDVYVKNIENETNGINEQQNK